MPNSIGQGVSEFTRQRFVLTSEMKAEMLMEMCCFGRGSQNECKSIHCHSRISLVVRI